MELRFELSHEQQMKVARNLELSDAMDVVLQKLIQTGHHAEMLEFIKIIKSVNVKIDNESR